MAQKRKRETSKHGTTNAGGGDGGTKRRATKNKGVGLSSGGDGGSRGVRSRSISEQQYLFCMKLIDDFLSKHDCFSFSKPVLELWSIEVVPTYMDVIKHPMDLGTIKKNLKNEEYGGKSNFKPSLFQKHARLVFQNCQTYNADGTPLFQLATKLLKLFDTRFKHLPVEKKTTTHYPSSEIDPDEDFDKTSNASSDTTSELELLVQRKKSHHRRDYDEGNAGFHHLGRSKMREREREFEQKSRSKNRGRNKQTQPSVKEEIIDSASVLSKEKDGESQSEHEDGGGSKLGLRTQTPDTASNWGSDDESSGSNDGWEANESDEEYEDEHEKMGKEGNDDEEEEEAVKSTRSESPDGVWALPPDRRPAAERTRLTRRMERQQEVVKKSRDEAKSIEPNPFTEAELRTLKDEIEHSDYPVQRKAVDLLDKHIVHVLGKDYKQDNEIEFVSLELGKVEHEYLRKLEEIFMPRTARGKCLARAKQFYEASRRTQARIDALTRGGRKKQRPTGF